MQLAFEQVSYSYEPPRKRKKNDRAAGAAAGAAGAAAAGAAGAAGAASGAPDWGNAADHTWALRDVTLTVEEGDFLGIAGHTGSGKSTLVQLANGLLHPTAGRVTFDGQDLADRAALRACRGKVGVVFQYPEHQLFAATVYDDVAFGPRNMKLPEDQVDTCVRTAMAQVGLDFDEIRDRSPFELSGGQQRRVAFAGVLAMSPSVLVLDEPAAGLDPASRSNFLQLIRDLHSQGLTVVMVSHSMDDLAALCTRLVVLNQGAVVLEGSPAQVFSHTEELHAIGLDVPAANAMANALRTGGVNVPDAFYTSAEQLADALAALAAPAAPAAPAAQAGAATATATATGTAEGR